MKLQEQTFASHQAMIDSLTLQITDHLKSAIEHYGQASFIVSGGSTPKPLYEELSHQPLAWDHVTLCPSDERWVELGHPDSNQTMIESTLLQHAASEASLISLRPQIPFSDAPAIVNQSLMAIHKPFNLVLLGMGEDGHIASLFPDANELEHGLAAPHSEPCISVHSASKGARLSLTLPSLLNSEQIYLLITGESKREVFQRAKQHLDNPTLPIEHLLSKATCPITLCWSPNS
ncbi:6-phosphogluconolactonase [Litoribrevibacter albus]|uniref:6-phosphogluconolactonase n=1 Tax=Litoribrevibacter albus TaxID=1473156 RepID=A0AA37W6Y4_9GAMM|nr:6-phosphogluconolactonase [Litoribrevibacter albus]GLQ30524.1 6-phosphogluconolactonase [Litoribrevibacter albus]